MKTKSLFFQNIYFKNNAKTYIHNFWKITLSIAIMLIFIFNMLYIVNAALICNPKVYKYELTNSSGENINVMETDETGKLVIYIADDTVKTNLISSVNNINVSALNGCFSAEKPDSTEIISESDLPVKYKLTYNRAVYNGNGKTVNFTIEYMDLNITSSNIAFTVSLTSKPEIPAANNPPYIEVTANNISEPVQINTEFNITLNIKNKGDTKIERGIITLDTPDPIYYIGISKIQIPDINANSSKNITLKFKTADILKNISETIDFTIDYEYSAGEQNKSSSYSGKIYVPLDYSSKNNRPVVKVTRDDLEQPIKAGETFTLNVTIKNIGNSEMYSPLISFSYPNKSNNKLNSLENNSNIEIPNLKPNEEKKIELNIKAPNRMLSSSLEILADVDYSYNSSHGMKRVTDRSKITLPVLYENKDKPKPFLKITGNNINNNIKAGEIFIIGINIKNLGNIKIISPLVSITYPDGITPLDNISDIKISDIASGENKKINIKLKSSADLTARSADINIEVKYRYSGQSGIEQNTDHASFTIPFEKNTRQNEPLLQTETENISDTAKITSYNIMPEKTDINNTASENVFVPIYTPDKLEIIFQPIDSVYVGYEQNITLEYANKGANTLSNVKTEIIGDISTLTPVQNIGNIESGENGTFNFIVIPEEVGENEFIVRVRYEDLDHEEKTLDFPCVMTVKNNDELAEEVFNVMPENENNEISKTMLAIIAAGIIAAAIIIATIIKKR